MHVVLYIPPGFYSAVASAMVETLQVVNDVAGYPAFTFEFVSPKARAVSKSGIQFPSRVRPSRKMDVLILMTGASSDVGETMRILDEDAARAEPLIRKAEREGAVIAATCGAAYLLAASGLLEGKRATISWWLKRETQARFPLVRWEASRMVVRDGRYYTSGASLAGLELITRLLVDLGFSEEERQVRKIMLFPPVRQLQTPYEVPAPAATSSFAEEVERFADTHLRDFDPSHLAAEMGLSPRTLARRFADEFQMSPGRWIQERRLAVARGLLEETDMGVMEICLRVGYQDTASFTRLFSRRTGMAPGEFRKQLR